MNIPKRHHWWPELQSRHWTNKTGRLYVVKADGSYFETTPENVGVEGHLYLRHTPSGDKDIKIEKWFSSDIEGPFRECLEILVELPGLRREPCQLDKSKVADGRALGFIVKNYRETIELPAKHRVALANYLAALVVRSPRYLHKIQKYHAVHSADVIKAQSKAVPPDLAIKSISLDDMLRLFNRYREKIADSSVMFTKREGESEFLFSDAGITPEEPWRADPVPFDIFSPLTPELAVTVLPSPAGDFRGNRRCTLGRAKSQGIARLNRKIIGSAERFVFSRSKPPIDFIKKHFGKPAPRMMEVSWKDGHVEVRLDRSKDKLARR